MVYNLPQMENKGASITRAVQKKAGRAKEMLLQNFGKADRTTDELFEVYHSNFNKQQASATRLQKELKNYVSCVRAMQAASKGLYDCLTEIYEPEWPGHDQMPVKATVIDNLWEEMCHKLNDQVTIPLSTYLSQFSEVRAKIAKRGRKLVDYDSSRHALESLEANKKRDEIKVAKAREQLEESRRLYEVLNKELHDELPALYDSRIPFMISSLQLMFAAETTFHSEQAKVHGQLAGMVDQLAEEAQKGAFHSCARRLPSATSQLNHSQLSGQSQRHYEEIQDHRTSTTPQSPTSPHQLTTSSSASKLQGDGLANNLPTSPSSVGAGDALKSSVSPNTNGDAFANVTEKRDSSSTDVADQQALETSLNQEKKSEEVYDIPAGATTTDLPPGVLYKVRATYKYVAEDADELSFEVGEVIRVIEYEDPEEQEEGWLMGIKESDGTKGLFPANFTRPI